MPPLQLNLTHPPRRPITVARWLACSVLVALCLAVPLAQAAQFNVSPVKVTLSARAKSTSVTISNTGKQPVALRVRLYAWNKLDGADQLSPAEDLVVTPPILKLEGGRSQIVRIGRPAEIPVPEIEQSYRLVVTELALPDEKQPEARGLALRALLEISVPLFVPPAKPSKQLEWSLGPGAGADSPVALNVFNFGTAHSKITQLRLVDSAGGLVAESGQLFYVLPRQSSRPALSFTRKPRPGEALRLEYKADHAGRTAELKAPGP